MTRENEIFSEETRTNDIDDACTPPKKNLFHYLFIYHQTLPAGYPIL
jgi:hypothetical protein